MFEKAVRRAVEAGPGRIWRRVRSGPARRALAGAMAACLLLTLLPASALAADVPDRPTAEEKNIYANGLPLLLAEGADSTKTVVYVDEDRSGDVSPGDTIFTPGVGGADNGTEAGNDLSAFTIYGGSKKSYLTGDTGITMTGGMVETICGGNEASYVDGSTNVTVTGGTVSRIYGVGNGNASTVGGGITITLTGGQITGSVSARGFGAGTDPVTVAVGGGVRIGSDRSRSGIYIGTGTDCVDSISIESPLSGDVYVDLINAAEGDVIATGASAGDLSHIHLIGADGLTAVLDSGSIKLAVPAPTVVDNSLFANGLDLKLEAGKVTDTVTYTKVFYRPMGSTGDYTPFEMNAEMNADGSLVDGYDLTEFLIYGGAMDTDVASASVTMTGGKVKTVIGGGGFDGNVGAGGSGVAVTVIIGTDATVTNKVYGGGMAGQINGGTSVTVNGSVEKDVYGGGISGAVTGDAAVTVTGAVDGTVYGGGMSGTVTGTTAVTVSGTVGGDVYGGSYSRAVGTEGQTGETAAVIITAGGEVTGSVYGGGDGGQINGGTSVTVSGTVKDAVYGGSGANTVTGDAAVIITADGTVTGSVYGGGDDGPINGSASVTVRGAVGGDVYGGSSHGDVGAEGQKTSTATVIIDTGATVTGSVYGGGQGGKIHGSTSVAVSGAVDGTVYGGGSGGGKVMGTTAVTVGGTAGAVYGGGDNSSVGTDGQTGETAVVLIDTGATVTGVVYGGCLFGQIIGNTSVTVNGTVGGTIYGGSDTSSVTGTTAVTVSGTVKDVYGGGRGGTVGTAGRTGETTAVTIEEGGRATGNVYGGNYGGTIHGGASATVNGAVDGTVCGGSDEGKITGDVAVIISGTAGDVYSDSGETATIGGKASITVHGTVAGNVIGGHASGGTIPGGTTVAVGGGAKIGGNTGKGVILNGGSSAVVKGVDSFSIDAPLTAGAAVYAVLPEGAVAGRDVATGAAEGDLPHIHLTGPGAEGLKAVYSDAKVKTASIGPAAELWRSGVKTGDYPNLPAAAEAAQSGDMLKLARDVTLRDTLSIGKPLTLDLNGHTLTRSGGGNVVEANGCKLTVKDGNPAGGGAVVSTDMNTAICVDGTGELELLGGTVRADDSAAILSTGGDVTVGGSAVISNFSKDLGAINMSGVSGKVTIKDMASVTNAAPGGYAVITPASSAKELPTYFSAEPTATVGAVFPECSPTVVDGIIYANGSALVIEADGEGTTVYVDKNRNGVHDNNEPSLKEEGVVDAPENGSDLSLWNIYGGSLEANLTGDTKITLAGGKVGIVYGGGRAAAEGKSANVSGSTSITVSGGEAWSVCGGGYASGTGTTAHVKGNSSVTLKDGKVAGVCGGGVADWAASADVAGTATVDMSGGTVDYSVYGGGSVTYGTCAVGAVSLRLTGGTVKEDVYGGGEANGDATASSAVTGGVTIDVSNNAVLQGSLYGGGRAQDGASAPVGGETSLLVNGSVKIGNSGGEDVAGVVLNGGGVTNGVDYFHINGTLVDPASVYVVPPVDMALDTIVAYCVNEDDVTRLHLTGPGAAYRKLVYEGRWNIRLAADYQAEYTTDGGATWTPGPKLMDAIRAMENADNSQRCRIRLLSDVTDILGPGSGVFTIDLNGFTCFSEVGFPALKLQGTASVTLTDSVGGGGVRGSDASESGDAARAVHVGSDASLTLTGERPFTIRGGDGLDGVSDTAKASRLKGADAIYLYGGLTVSGTGNIQILGGRGGSATGAWTGRVDLTGGSGVFARDSASVNVSNPNALIRGGNGGDAADASGLYAIANGAAGVDQRGGSFTASAGTFRGGDGGNAPAGQGFETGGNGLDLRSCGTPARISGVTCTGGAAGGPDGSRGNGAGIEDMDAVVDGGDFTGSIGLSLGSSVMGSSLSWTVNGGLFTGEYAGLYVVGAGSRLSVTGGVFTGDRYGFNSDDPEACLSGGTFTGDGPDAYAVAYRNGVGLLLAEGMAYFDEQGAKLTEGLTDSSLGKNATLRVRPENSAPERLYTVSGEVYDSNSPGLDGSVELRQGGQVLRTYLIKNESRMSFAFTGVAPGVYTLVAVNRAGGSGNALKTDTRLVTITDGDVTGLQLGWNTDKYTSSVVDVLSGAPGVDVGGLDRVAAKVPSTSGSPEHTVRLTVEAGADADDRAAIAALAAGKSVDLYMDLTLELLVEGETPVLLSDAKGQVLELAVPWDLTEGRSLSVYRCHNGAAEALTALASAPENPEDGTFWVDAEFGYIHIYAGAFSAYAIATYVPAGPSGSGPSAPSRARWNPFADVAQGDWFHDAVRFVYERGLMEGVSASAFDPLGRTDRGMFAAILWREAGRPAASAGGSFTDVVPGAYYAPAVAWADETGVAVGYGNGRFGPADPITREQIVTVLWRYAGSPAAGGGLDGFSDADGVSPFAVRAMAWAVERGIIQGKGGGVLDPKGPATRAETAAILKRYLTAE